MGKVEIKLPHHRYDVVVEPGALLEIGQRLRKLSSAGRCALLVDETVFGLHGERVLGSLQQADFDVLLSLQPAGEKHKTLDTVQSHYDRLLEGKLERGSPVVALGGGVLGDTAGFVAATYLRGVPFVQCPTTLLSMVDASVGGKVGVNVVQGKNLVGSFYQPHAVVVDPLVLETLPERELRCGLAECVKHGVIRDQVLFEWTEANLSQILALQPQVMTELIERNISVKAAVVMEDERESGVRAHLNFGHTFGHAVEQTGGYGVIKHGEAVALGMIAAAQLAVDRKLCSADVVQRLLLLLNKIGLPIKASLVPTDELIGVMKRDKKVQAGKIRFVIPASLGSVSIVDDVEEEELKKVWSLVRE